MPTSESIIPVIVLGGGITGLGVVRNFGRLGIPVFVVCESDDLVCASRWYRPAPDVLKDSLISLSERLRALPISQAVLLPCSDFWTTAIADLDIAGFRKSSPSKTALDMFVDKAAFARLLCEQNIPHPFTHFLEREEDIDDIPEELFENLFLKPCDSQRFFAQYGVKAFRVSSREYAKQQFRNISKDNHKLLLQEYIPGTAADHYFIDGFVDRFGKVQVMFARRRLRIFPPDFGNSTFMRSVPLEEVAPCGNSIAKLLPAIGYRGIFSAEFKQDQRDGSFRIIEVNARAWWFVDFACVSGANVCQLAYCDALELPFPPMNVRSGETCMYAYHDFFSFAATKPNQQTWWDWFQQVCHSYMTVFSWDDPFPGIKSTWSVIVQSLLRRLQGPP